MKIHEFQIEGFKSIGEIKLVEPNPFSVFVGPNGAGKSNIFEAIELFELCDKMNPIEAVKLFGNANEIINQKTVINSRKISFNANLESVTHILELGVHFADDVVITGMYTVYNWGSYFHTIHKNKLSPESTEFLNDENYKALSNFSRIFISESESKTKKRNQDDSRLNSDASNLEKVLKRILKDEKNRNEIVELLQLLIPGFSNVEIRTEELSGSDNLLVYEDALQKPLTKRLISDGTYNILAIIAAIYQSETPQFLCIEEPENGLNPKVVGQLVNLFRDKCKEKGHYIWLNTHSQSLVAELTPEEIILVDKVDGQTQTRQVKDFDLHGMRADEALLTNAFGGGIPW